MTAFFRELYPGQTHPLVFGEGDVGAGLLLIGEAPGEQEVAQGRPFVGKAGKNLDELLALAGLERGALYITNAVKIRPTKLSAAGRVVNRPPTKEE
ncbi:MAG: uracil-DNA glycosylase, partial [Eubacteriales bacterium]|nr:uracil-DNA glycosylase [Eubacteriales bacterium]